MDVLEALREVLQSMQLPVLLEPNLDLGSNGNPRLVPWNDQSESGQYLLGSGGFLA